MADTKNKDLSVEKALEKLESGEASLEKSIELYEEGRRLGAVCRESLDALERRVQLVREGADGKPVLEDLDPEEARAD